MREIGGVRQDGSLGLRRWFQDEYFDLFVWQAADGRPIAFQLCYERGGDEGAISWHESQGFAHARVDAGEQMPFASRTPILRPDGTPPYFRIVQRLLDDAGGWDDGLHAFVLARLREYRRVLFGGRLAPRRRGSRRCARHPARRGDAPQAC